ncbi:RUS1 family protein C16orf58 homolog [Neolamprologus brichardi]|uniref:RUS1 family protein C16orf58 homolog n=1 Tax=Neolamprologus brichardi TaxID=32507 RepID=UPI001643AA3C|nr:RUS1 family protein C16orf58 homolog [Neolamprologus brichardi]
METDKGVVLATERYGSAESWKYVSKDGVMERRRDGSEGHSGGNSVFGVFKSVFLPQGYPESVSDDYLQYQFWDTMQAFSSSLSGTLATQASLRGVGVGNQEATVAAATVTWLLKDGTGMLGRILFAWRKGSKLDSEAKKWRLFADVLNDIAMFMEILAPYFPACFTFIVCTAGIFKSIVGVAGGATRAALTVHQARRDNMADISAKDGSQETLVNLAGLLVSLILIPLVTDNPVLTLCLFFLLFLLLPQFVYSRCEPLVCYMLKLKTLRKHVIQLKGISLSFCSFCSPEDLELALKENSMPYLLGVRNGCVCVCLGPEASVSDEIRAMCQAVVLSNMLSSSNSREATGAAPKQQKGHWEMVHKSHKLMDAIFNPLLKGAEAAGWDMKRTLIDWDEWRVEWKTKSS